MKINRLYSADALTHIREGTPVAVRVMVRYWILSQSCCSECLRV